MIRPGMTVGRVQLARLVPQTSLLQVQNGIAEIRQVPLQMVPVQPAQIGPSMKQMPMRQITRMRMAETQMGQPQMTMFFQSSLFLHQDISPHDQERKANLGKMIEDLKLLLPNVLKKSLPKLMISSDVLLRVCPTHFDEFNAYLPNIKGHVTYYTTLKTIQMVLSSVILNPKVKLHLHSIKIMNPQESNIEYLCVYPESTKIQVRWSTCNEGCHHLMEDNNEMDEDNHNFQSTSNAKFGSHRWSKVDPSKFSGLDNKKSINSIGRTIAHLSTGSIGLSKEKQRLERMISGIFIFELNKDHTEILVHTIEDVDIIEKPEAQEVSALRIC